MFRNYKDVFTIGIGDQLAIYILSAYYPPITVLIVDVDQDSYLLSFYLNHGELLFRDLNT